MEFYKQLLLYKSTNKIGYREIGELIDMKADAVRRAIDRKSLSDLQKKELAVKLDLDFLEKAVLGTGKKSEIPKLITLDESIFINRSKLDALIRFLLTNHQKLIEDPLYALYISDIEKKAIIEYEKERIRKKAVEKINTIKIT